MILICKRSPRQLLKPGTHHYPIYCVNFFIEEIQLAELASKAEVALADGAPIMRLTQLLQGRSAPLSDVRVDLSIIVLHILALGPSLNILFG